VIVVGFAAQRRRWSANVGLGLSLTFFAVVAGLAALVGFPYEYFTRAIFRPYPLIAYGVLALWLGLGLAEIRRWAASWHRRLAPAAWLLPAAAILSLGFHGGLRANDRHAYRYSRDYAETLLGSFAPDAVVVGYGDVESFTFGYYHFVEGVRPDVRLLNERALGAALDGRLFDPRYATPRDTVVHATRLVRETDRPVYFFTTPPFSFGDADYGFYYQVDRTQNERTSLELTDELVDLYRRIVSEDEHTDRWTVHHRYRVVKRFAATLAAVLALGGEDMRERYGVDLDQASVEFAGAWADLWFHYGQGSLDQRQLLDRLERAESLVDEVVPRRDLAALYLLKGRVLKGLGRNDEAVAALRRSVEMRPAPDNEAFADLRRLEEAPAPGTSR
jgi:tetratricopeptide (TPR) repeat protein